MAVIEPLLVELPLVRNVEVSLREGFLAKIDVLIEIITARLQVHVALMLAPIVITGFLHQTSSRRAGAAPAHPMIASATRLAAPSHWLGGTSAKTRNATSRAVFEAN